ncbi:carbohydrate kinase [Nonomuraea sp. NPDC050556]|uniref:carbohydrate kinase n=1 Tax=Nonomuraea sp. NPDC050556 TaxID=3364369 RepID=UPI00379CB9C1
MDVAVLGECVADAFATRLPGELSMRVLPGGGPANTAVALSRLGTVTRFLGRLSTDVFGELFREHLSASGVDLSGCVTAAEPSTLAVATVDRDGHASYSFHAEGAADWQWTAAELSGLAPMACLHTGSMALLRSAAVEELLASVDATVSIDPNVRPSFGTREEYLERLPRWCALADVLKLSDDDLAYLLPGTSVEAACDGWHALGARLVVVTRGAGGALVSLDGRRAAVPARSVAVVDTVGAGDSFTAGFLHWLDGHGHLGGRLDLDLDTAVEAAAFAVRVAAWTCSVAGANPPWASELSVTP